MWSAPNNMKIKLKLGFTLVELLVVISIIGVLTSIATVNLLTAQKQARDSRRVGDMGGAQTALETYYAENQAYPLDVAIDSAFDSGNRPQDPRAPTQTYSWLTDTDTYCLCAAMESKVGNANSVGTSAGCDWGGTNTYHCVQNRQ